MTGTDPGGIGKLLMPETGQAVSTVSAVVTVDGNGDTIVEPVFARAAW